MTAVICFILSAMCLILSALQFAEKGFCFHNAYIFASEEERKTMNKKTHYKQSAILFACLCCTFLLIGLYAIFQSLWLFVLAIGFAMIALIYAIVSSIKNYLKNK